MRVPKKLRWTSWISPEPPHRVHRVGYVPGSDPVPPHRSHVSSDWISTSRCVPNAASSSVNVTGANTSSPGRVLVPRPRVLVPPKPEPKKTSKMSPNGNRSGMAWEPKVSYWRLLTGSESTSYAAVTRLNRSPASGSPLTSGWSSRASFR